MKKVKNVERNYFSTMDGLNEVETLSSDDLFHYRTDTRRFIPNNNGSCKCTCECMRLKELETLDEPAKSSDFESFLKSFTILPFLWIFSAFLATASSKERWKFLWIRFDYICAPFCLCMKSSRDAVIKHLFRPILRISSSFKNRNVNKQNLRWHRRSLTSFLLLEWLYYLLVLNYFCTLSSWSTFLRLLPSAEACSTRPSPKPRPIRPVWAPEPSLPRENCTDDYAELFCMNGGTCFRSKFVDQYAIGCECTPGWFGRRCEFQDFMLTSDSSLKRVETASIAGGAAVLVILFVFILLVVYVYRRKTKMKASSPCISASAFEEPAHRSVHDILPVRPFSVHRPDHLQRSQSIDDIERGLAHVKNTRSA